MLVTLTFLPLVEDGRARMVYTGLLWVGIHLAAALVDALLGHYGFVLETRPLCESSLDVLVGDVSDVCSSCENKRSTTNDSRSFGAWRGEIHTACLAWAELTMEGLMTLVDGGSMGTTYTNYGAAAGQAFQLGLKWGGSVG